MVVVLYRKAEKLIKTERIAEAKHSHSLLLAVKKCRRAKSVRLVWQKRSRPNFHSPHLTIRVQFRIHRVSDGFSRHLSVSLLPWAVDSLFSYRAITCAWFFFCLSRDKSPALFLRIVFPLYVLFINNRASRHHVEAENETKGKILYTQKVKRNICLHNW